MRLLDLFCGAGGAAMGYHRAGFEDILGIDLNPQPNYPFKFIKMDVADLNLDYIAENFDFIHASPPCQAYSRTRSLHKEVAYPNLIPSTRLLLQQTNLPYIIENVPGAPIRHDLKLCGGMFSLPLVKHRFFESNLSLYQPPHQPHNYKSYTVAGHMHGINTFKKAMGIDWMTTRHELAEAIPPAYTEEIGRQILAQLGARLVA